MLTRDGTNSQQKGLLFLISFLILVTVWQLSTNSYLIHSTCTLVEKGHKGHDAVILEGEDAIIPKGEDAIIPKGEDAIIPKGEDAIFLVMGQTIFFKHWYDMLEPIDGIHIDYVFASYDAPVEIPDLVGSLSADTLFIPGTTWTQGRNALALRAAEKEVERGKKYDFWIFLDDDVSFDCSPIDPHSQFAKLTTEGASCAQMIFDFLTSDYLMGNDKITSFSAQQTFWKQNDNLRMATNSFADANLYGYKRKYVPYFLPYSLERPGFSPWLSQMAVFCIVHHCFPQSVLLLPHVQIKNTKHRDETSRHPTKEQEALFYADNLDFPQHNFSICYPDDPLVREKSAAWLQSTNIIRADTPNELWDMIPEPDGVAKCEALKLEHWDNFIAHLNYEGVE